MPEPLSDDDVIIEDMRRTPAERTLEAFRRLASALRDANSAMPATAEFLRERGLTHIDQLDDEGRRELILYLQRVFRRIQEERRRGSA